MRLGIALGAHLARPVVVGADAVGRSAATRLERATLDAVETVGEARFTRKLIDRLLDSPAVEHVVGRVLAGHLIDVAARDMVRYTVVERVTEQLVAGDAMERALSRVESAGVPERLTSHLLADGLPERMATRLVEGPELERVVEAVLASPGLERVVDAVVASPGLERVLEQALDSPGMERLVGSVVDSRVVDTAVTKLLESDDLWLLVDEIARSPSVTEAISKQGLSFADQFAGAVRERSTRADARLERLTHRITRRRSNDRVAAPPEPDV